MKPIIELNNIYKKFRDETVIDGINLKLHDNMIYGFVGRNGSGKSVLFKIICGYIRVDEGEVRVGDRVIGDDLEFPDNLGALIENPGFLWHETGLDNLRFLAEIKNRIIIKEIEDTMRMVGLDPKSKKKVGKYSLGMKQRLGIAQAIMEKPDILVLDETMNGLDDAGVELIRQVILDYKKEGTVILLASHNKEDIELLCDEVFILNGGKITKRI